MDILNTEEEERTMASVKKHKERSHRGYSQKESNKQRGFIIIASHNHKAQKGENSSHILQVA